MDTTNVLIAGVGGQGVVLASELLAQAALAGGFDVKQGEFHGVAQRGGAVYSHVRFGERVHSPTARRGEVDVLVALELLEALRHGHFVRPGGTVLVNDHRIDPIRTADDRPYPDDVPGFLSGKGLRVLLIPATERAVELGNARAANVVLLGALSAHLPLPVETWERVLRERIPERYRELNLRAFAAGREAVGAAV